MANKSVIKYPQVKELKSNSQDPQNFPQGKEGNFPKLSNLSVFLMVLNFFSFFESFGGEVVEARELEIE